MDLTNLKQFLLASNKAGYAGGEEKKWIKNPDGSTTIPYEQGDWRSHDNFFGGEPYGGRVVVFHKNKPFWIMVYYGWIIEGVTVDPVYSVLRGALMQMPEAAPFRGPREYKQDDFTYANTWEGNLEHYSGAETITQKEKLVYQANYFGGLIDQRSGV